MLHAPRVCDDLHSEVLKPLLAIEIANPLAAVSSVMPDAGRNCAADGTISITNRRMSSL